MKEDFVITIQIADTDPVPMNIRREDEAVVRTVEYQVNKLWALWRERFKQRSANEVLAMVAFQFARLYYNIAEHEPQLNATMEQFEKELDSILLKID
ncbi:MAG: cell division protein ZapA [Muribaculaceae bacterium]|jgi:hypothetical protein|nr:cell division protein ZapA [Muribaculaceae bacterium]HUN20423.1 cell division protein ZapA [Muribaculaceae bacterium]